MKAGIVEYQLFAAMAGDEFEISGIDGNGSGTQ
jgi:hypothetical protein